MPPAKMSQRVSLSDGEGLLPALCSEPRAGTDQRVRQRSTHRVRDFVFARLSHQTKSDILIGLSFLVHDLY